MRSTKTIMGAAHPTLLAVAGLALAVLMLAPWGVAFAGDGGGNGYMGIYMQELTRDLRRALDIDVKKGVLVSGVEDGSPADEAGLEDGDVIIAYDGQKVSSSEELGDLVRETEVGEEIKVKVVRDGDEIDIKIVIGERPEGGVFIWGDDDSFDWARGTRENWGSFVSAFRGWHTLGVQAREMNDELADYFKVKEGEGILVLDVVDDSVAEEIGVKGGDVIQKVDDEEIGSVDDLREVMHDLDDGDEFALTIVRKGKTMTLEGEMKVNTPAYFRAPRVRVNVPRIDRIYIDGDELREELDELKEQLKELKKELKELKKG